MSLPPLVVLGIKQGDTHRFRLTWTEDDQTPIDVTGWSWEFTAAKQRRGPSTNPYWSYGLGDPQVVELDPENGVIEVTVFPDDSRAFGRQELVQFEVTGTAPGDGTERKTTVDGTFAVRLEVANMEPGP